MFNSLFGNSSLKEKIKKLETQLQEATAEASFWKEATTGSVIIMLYEMLI